MAVRNATEFCRLVSNRLGYVPPGYGEKPDWQVWRIEEAKLNRTIAAHEKKERGTKGLFTWPNLELAVEYLWRQRKSVKSPAGVLYYVKAAVDASNIEAPRTDLTAEVNAALAWEMAQEPGNADWISRLTRAHGSARADLLEAWRKAQRG